MIRFFFFLFIVNLSLAQDISFQIEKSKLFEDKYKDSEIVLAEKTEEDKFIIVRSFESKITTKSGFYIEYYDTYLTQLNNFEFLIKRPNHEKYKVILGTFYTNSSVNIIELYYDLKRKKYVCINNKINDKFIVEQVELFSLKSDEIKGFGIQSLYKSIDKLNLSKDNLGLFKLEEDVDFRPLSFSSKSSVSDRKGRSELLLKTNKDKSFYTIALTYKQKKADYTKVFLFDANNRKLIEQNFSCENGRIINKNIEVSEQSPILYLSQKVFSKDLNKKSTGGEYFYEINRISTNGIKKQKIEIDSFYLPSLNVFMIQSKLYAFGFYSEKKEFEYSGISFFELDSQTLDIKKVKYNSFSDQFIIDKYGKVKEKELKNIVIKSVFLNHKNEICFNAEENYAKTYSTGGPYYNTSYFYDDILTLRFNDEGQLILARNINKNQATRDLEDGSFFSYSSLVFKDKTYFFINTKDEVRKISNDRIEFKDVSKNNSNLFVIQVNSNGEFDYKEVLSKENNEVPFMVSKGVVIDNSIIFLGRKGKDKQLLKVTLN